MHDILPDGEDLRRAVRWTSVKRQESPEQPLPRIVQEAVFKFDLSPRDAEFLIGFFRELKKES